jgi:hypothetical protein
MSGNKDNILGLFVKRSTHRTEEGLDDDEADEGVGGR